MEYENGQSAAKHLKSWYENGEGSTTILVGGVPIEISRFDWEKVDFVNDKFFVYCLACPFTLEIRYIGITVNYQTRYRTHCYTYEEKKRNWKMNWVRSIRRMGQKPVMLKLDEIQAFGGAKTQRQIDKFVDLKEREYIHLFAKSGYRLVNHDKLVSSKYEYNAMGQHKNKKSVYQYFTSGSFLMEWPSLKSVIEHYGMKYPTLSSAMTRKGKSFGFYWSLEKMDKFVPPPIHERNSKKCYQYDLLGNFICSHSSVAEASRSTGIDRNCIKDNINGIQMSAHKFVFTSVKKEKNERYSAKSNRYKDILHKEDIV